MSGEMYGIGKGSPDLDEPIKSERTDVALAKKAGIGKSSMAYLLAVYRNRLDLFELVFDGSYSINKAYTQMKDDEEPEQEAKANSLANLKQNTDSANLHTREMSGEVADKLAKKAGMSKRNLYFLLAVYRNRLDLFELVFDGTYTINKAYQRVAGEAIFEIGRRLKHVKENDLAHGEWAKWLKDSVNFTQRHANRFIRVFERFADVTPELRLPSSITILNALIPFTDEQLTTEYELPNGEKKKPVDMSRREIEELKRQLRRVV